MQKIHSLYSSSWHKETLDQFHKTLKSISDAKATSTHLYLHCVRVDFSTFTKLAPGQQRTSYISHVHKLVGDAENNLHQDTIASTATQSGVEIRQALRPITLKIWWGPTKWSWKMLAHFITLRMKDHGKPKSGSGKQLRAHNILIPRAQMALEIFGLFQPLYRIYN